MIAHLFQSRYRAASHFRLFQSKEAEWVDVTFQSRYRAASHFRLSAILRLHALRKGFNLVIERLLISGNEPRV